MEGAIFSGMGGWIAYGNGVFYGDTHFGTVGIWAMDPKRKRIRKQLSTDPGEPLAWSNDGSKLLILKTNRPRFNGGRFALRVER